MSFLDQAKEVLDEAKVTRLAELAKKSADFDTSSEEDTELFNLKAEVKKAIATRDREKNLSFLKEGGYTIAEILRAMNAQEKDIKKAVAEIYPTAKTVYKPYAGVLANFDGKEYKLSEGNREVNKKVREAGVKPFVAGLTEEGKNWLMEGIGKKRGEGFTYMNVQAIASRYKFDKKELMVALGLVEAPAENKPKAKLK